MTKAILLSIRPEHALNILNGNKTLELRKSVPKDFKGWVYVYVTKAKPYLEPREFNGKFIWNIHNDFIYHTDLNSTIPFRFWFDEYEEYHYFNLGRVGAQSYISVETENNVDLCEKSCLDIRYILDYGKGKNLYAWHIKKLDVFQKPMELSDFQYCSKWKNTENGKEFTIYNLSKAPQSYQYVLVNSL